MASAPSPASNSPSSTHLVSCRNPNLPTNFPDESYWKAQKDPAIGLDKTINLILCGSEVDLPGLTDSESRKAKRHQNEECRAVQPWRLGKAVVQRSRRHILESLKG